MTVNPMYSISKNPDNNTPRDTFIPKAYSIYNWGGIPDPGVNANLELEANTEKPYYTAWDRVVTLNTVDELSSPNYSWYGMGNMYNAMRIWKAYKEKL